MQPLLLEFVNPSRSLPLESNVALRRLLVLLPGDISFSVVHRAECSRASILQCSELKGRKKKSRLSLGNISDYFNIEQENTLVPIYTAFYYRT